MNYLQKKLSQLLSSLLPTQRRTIYDHRTSPNSLAATLDVDRVHQIFDNAQAGSTTDLFALYRDIVIADSHIQGEFAKRKLAVLGDPLLVQPFDKKNPDDVAAAEAVKNMVVDTPSWLDSCIHLMDSSLWPVAIAEKIYESNPTDGYRLKEIVPVPDQLLDYSTGKLRIWETDARGNKLGSSFEPEEGRYIIHRGNLLSMPDNWGGPMRSLVFWWLLSAMDRDWWVRFLDRYGSPFLVGKYDAQDTLSRSILERAFSYAVKIGGLVVTNETSVEIANAASGQNADSYEKFFALCQREKSKLIVGQTTSAEAQSTGLGSGIAKAQQQVRSDFRQFDAMKLANTLRSQLFAQFLSINGMKGRPPIPVWSSDTSEAAQLTGALLSSLAQSGLQVSDNALPVLSERLGLEIVRAPAPAAPAFSPFSALTAYTADPLSLARHNDLGDLARNAAPSVSRAFSGSLAPIRRLILSSQSPEELEAHVRSFYADWSAKKVASVLEEALTAYAANGAVATARKN
jgi:phage gp29-like protein